MKANPALCKHLTTTIKTTPQIMRVTTITTTTKILVKCNISQLMHDCSCLFDCIVIYVQPLFIYFINGNEDFSDKTFFSTFPISEMFCWPVLVRKCHAPFCIIYRKHTTVISKKGTGQHIFCYFTA